MKAETINRLLKKQSRAKTKRNVLSTADDRTPATHTGAGTPNEGEAEEEPAPEAPPAVIEEVPTLFRWISTTKHPMGTSANDGKMDMDNNRRMTLSFSVPLSALSVPSLPPTPVSEGGHAD